MMAVLTVFSAKGGCGASLIATNLALALAHSAPTVLLDLHGQEGTDDLLLDLRSPHAWPELLPVAAELTERHIELVGSRHPEGLVMLAALPQESIRRWHRDPVFEAPGALRTGDRGCAVGCLSPRRPS
jgi:Flp pilus assembly CpaE family ATPase